MKMRPIQELPPSLLGNNPLAGLFDFYCLIDPSTTSVLTYQNGILIEAGHKCFEQWTRTAACKDCISKQACRENRCRVKLEYIRDLEKGIEPDIPENYFPNDDADRSPVNLWRGHANLLFSNWLNYCVYQETPYKLDDIG